MLSELAGLIAKGWERTGAGSQGATLTEPPKKKDPAGKQDPRTNKNSGSAYIREKGPAQKLKSTFLGKSTHREEKKGHLLRGSDRALPPGERGKNPPRNAPSAEEKKKKRPSGPGR